MANFMLYTIYYLPKREKKTLRYINNLQGFVGERDIGQGRISQEETMYPQPKAGLSYSLTQKEDIKG